MQMEQQQQQQQEANQWNQSNQVQELRRLRENLVNNTAGYYTGSRIHHLRAIRISSSDTADQCNEWVQLFGNEILCPDLQNYAQAGQIEVEVSLLMQENIRAKVHLAIFIIHRAPPHHRQFRDGHLIQTEFGEGSRTHQTINRIFDVNRVNRVTVLQATQYQLLGFLASGAEATDLLHDCFLQDDFNPMQFPDFPDIPGVERRWHECARV
jgi:hypothetical protein